MAKSNAERQANYRRLHLTREDRTGARLHMVVSIEAADQLRRLAAHDGRTLRAALERIIATAARRLPSGNGHQFRPNTREPEPVETAVMPAPDDAPAASIQFSPDEMDYLREIRARRAAVARTGCYEPDDAPSAGHPLGIPPDELAAMRARLAAMRTG